MHDVALTLAHVFALTFTHNITIANTSSLALTLTLMLLVPLLSRIRLTGTLSITLTVTRIHAHTVALSLTLTRTPTLGLNPSSRIRQHLGPMCRPPQHHCGHKLTSEVPENADLASGKKDNIGMWGTMLAQHLTALGQVLLREHVVGGVMVSVCRRKGQDHRKHNFDGMWSSLHCSR